jgi:catechol 2,3-dioxygenase-like lactoylglutathione lyase family enzyme
MIDRAIDSLHVVDIRKIWQVSHGRRLYRDRMTTSSALPLGNFSVSVAVKDLAASRTFYQKLGFEVRGGNGKSWAILQNGTTTLGLFQGAFDRNILTFNPGWDAACNKLPDFVDVRELQRRLRAAGVEPVTAADESTTGPASFVLIDPDGNQILIDQHV